MTYLLDTDFISITAPFKARPDPRAMAWLDANRDRYVLSVVSIWEVEFGYEKLVVREARAKARDVRTWIDGLVALFGNRLIDLRADVAALGGRKLARAQALGVDPGFNDSLIAAQAELLGLTIVTGNRRHFEALGASILDPRAL